MVCKYSKFEIPKVLLLGKGSLKGGKNQDWHQTSSECHEGHLTFHPNPSKVMSNLKVYILHEIKNFPYDIEIHSEGRCSLKTFKKS